MAKRKIVKTTKKTTKNSLTENHDELYPLEEGLPSPTSIKSLSLPKLKKLRDEYLDKIEQCEFMYHDIDQLSGNSRLRSLFKTYNDKIYAAATRPIFLDKEAKAHQNVFKYRINGEQINIKLSRELTKKGLLYVLKNYRSSISGFWSIAEVSKTGKVKQIFISDTVDRELFFEYIDPKIHKDRQGGAPSISATVLELGTVVDGADGNKYEVKPFGKKQRWVKAITNPEDHPNFQKLYSSIYKWWQPLASGELVIEHRDQNYRKIKSIQKSNKARSKEISEIWQKLGNDPKVKRIITTGMSTDALLFFIYYLLEKIPADKIQEILKHRNSLDVVMKEPKLFFTKEEIHTKKDYRLKGGSNFSCQKVLEKLDQI